MLSIDRSQEKAVYLQIAEGIIRAVSQGQLRSGRRLPGTRLLAGLLSINRKTVEVAYDELAAQGWVEIRPSRGAFIANDLPFTVAQPIDQAEAATMRRDEARLHFPHSRLIPPYQSPPGDQIFVSEGAPDVRLAPMEQLIKNYRALVRGYQGRRLLGYGDVRGALRSRQILADYLQQTRGLNCEPGQILFTRGSQMGIYLFFRMLIRPGDRVLVTGPNYDVADWTIQAMGGELVRIPVDTQGMDIDYAAEIARRRPIRAAYITPHHHFPTTVTLSVQRRLQLLELARKHDFFILEDDYDYAFHYERAPILPLASIDRFDRVIYLGSFSKLLAPAVRVGYLISSPAMSAEIAKLRRIIDRQGDPLLESAVCRLIEDGDLQRHLKKVLRIYRQRRDHFCDLLHEKLKDHLTFERPEGGMAVWIRLKEPVNVDRLLRFCRQKGVYLDADRQVLEAYQGMRIGFAALSEAEMREVVEVLANFWAPSSSLPSGK